jgi:glycerophosphoryl diester phosphodiesterase
VTITGWIDTLFLHLADEVLARRRLPPPAPARLAEARLIAHRGVHGPGLSPENTLAAFDRAAACGVFGIECDVRFSADRLPLVLHDPVPARVFGCRWPVASMSLAELQACLPQIPSLAEVVRRYGGRLHLMLELKAAPGIAARQMSRALGEALATLEAGRDYHLLCEAPARFAGLDFAPPSACLPIARLNVAALSRLALSSGWGGITGHALLLGNATIRRHRAAGQSVGTGFINSVPALYREVRRGVAWLFSDRAPALQSVVDQARERVRSAPAG